LIETDIRVFVTLIRFEVAYHGLFKCNRRRIGGCPNLTAHVERMLALLDVAGSANLDHIKRGYYSITSLNPTEIVPLGPALGLPTSRLLRSRKRPEARGIGLGGPPDRTAPPGAPLHGSKQDRNEERRRAVTSTRIPIDAASQARAPVDDFDTTGREGSSGV
jgi:hypothetical protein